MKKILQSIKHFLSNTFVYQDEKSYEFDLPDDFAKNSDTQSNVSEQNDKKESIFPSLSVNLDYLKVKYNSLINSDITIREFNLLARDKTYSAFLIYIDGMVNSQMLNDFILQPLMLRNKSNTFEAKKTTKVVSTAITNNISVKRIRRFNLEDYIYNCLIPQNNIKKVSDFEEIINDINSGNCALFIDTIDKAFSLEVKGFKARGISEPSNEMVIRGSQESFVEVIRTNTSILRRLVNSEKLIIEKSTVGNLSKTSIAICYLKDIANTDLIAEVKYRINNLKIDSLISSGQLEQLIQDSEKSVFPQILSTERPDRAVSNLFQGRVIVLVNGSPYALIMPAILADFVSSPEDINLKFQYSNFLKVIRLIAFSITLLLPGLYVAITNFHQELIPTELLFAIAASREAVPFPVIVEILIMEVSFELIREGGLRVPSPIGPTLGIVGALILGEAAVSANLVSPILIIIVAITGICSFAMPSYAIGFTLRIYRFAYVILGYIAGFLGIGLGLFIQIGSLANLKSFGVSYLTSFTPKTDLRSDAKYFIPPLWKRERRPNFLNPQDANAQDKVSMGWKKIGKFEK